MASVKKSNHALLARLHRMEAPDASWTRADPPLVLDTACGSFLKDVEGREYLDLSCGFGALPFGHNPPHVKAVLEESLAMDRITHGLGDVYPSVDKIELLATLSEILPPRLCRTALCLSGAGACEYAMKTAILKTGGQGFIAIEGGYHGLDLGVLPLTGSSKFSKPFSPCFEHVAWVPRTFGEHELEQARTDLKERGIKPAGFIFEPILGRGGCFPLTSAQMDLATSWSKEHGIVSIVDEVLTGLGRTGRWFASESATADILCLGKTLGGGMPLSACVGTEEVMAAWPTNDGEAIHTGTFFGHPLSCRVATANLKQLANLDAPGMAKLTAERLKPVLAQQFARVPGFSGIRGTGLMLAVDLGAPGKGVELADTLRRGGVIAIPCGPNGASLALTPAFNVDPDIVAAHLSAIFRERHP